MNMVLNKISVSKSILTIGNAIQQDNSKYLKKLKNKKYYRGKKNAI